MNKIYSILIFAGIAHWSAQADAVKQPIQYNQEATQKLQEKLNTLSEKDLPKLGTVEFLKAVDELLLQGADPNVFRTDPKDPNDKEDTLIALLFASPLFGMFTGSINFEATENTIKTALSRGANLGHQGGKILRIAVIVGSPTMVKLAIDHGADMTYKDTDGDTLLQAVEKAIQQLKNELPTASERVRSSIQKSLPRLEQIHDILKTAEQKK